MLAYPYMKNKNIKFILSNICHFFESQKKSIDKKIQDIGILYFKPKFTGNLLGIYWEFTLFFSKTFWKNGISFFAISIILYI